MKKMDASDMRAVLERFMPEVGELEIEAVQAMPWGHVAKLSSYGVEREVSEIIPTCISARSMETGRSDFNEYSLVMIEAVGTADEEDEEDEEEGGDRDVRVIVVATHSMGENGDDECDSSLIGHVLIGGRGDAKAMRAHARGLFSETLGHCLVSSLDNLHDMVRQADDAAFASIAAHPSMHALLRRVAAAA